MLTILVKLCTIKIFRVSHFLYVIAYCPQSQTDWRQWLDENHLSRQSVWLVFYTKKSNIPSISWSEAVVEALCFGWIDSTRKTIDDSSYMQFFTKRKPESNWSKINKEKVKQLSESGRLTEAGLACVEVAKQNGSWAILDEVEDLIIPNDLEIAFEKHTGSRIFSKSEQIIKKNNIGLDYPRQKTGN